MPLRLSEVHPIAVIFIAFVAGISGSLFFEVPALYCLIILLPALFIRNKIFILAALFLALGLFRADLAINATASIPENCSGTWQVVDFPKKVAYFKTQLEVKPIKNDCALGRKVSLKDYGGHSLEIGDVIQAKLNIHEFNHMLYANLPSDFSLLGKKASGLLAFRKRLNDRIQEVFSPDLQKWYQALLIGNQAQLSRNDRYILQRTATSHLLAISGLHLALIIGIFFFLLQALIAQSNKLSTLVEPRSAALVLSFIFGGIYALLTGAQVPVLRALLMYSIIVLTWFIPFIKDRYSGVFIAGIVLLAINPFYLSSLSAQLSFLATLGVIGIYQRIEYLPVFVQWIVFQLLLSITLIPLTWSVWGGVSLIGFAINLLVIPWLGFIILIALFSLMFPLFAIISDYCLQVYLSVIFWGSGIDWSYIEPHWQPTILMGISLSLLIICLIVKSYRYALFITFMTVLLFLKPFPSDVYQYSDSSLAKIIFSDNQTIVVNTAYRSSRQDNTQRYLIPELRKRGENPDAIIITNASIRATSGIKTLLSYYPDTTIYSLIPLVNFPFAYRYCPEESPYGLEFQKDRHCTAIIDNKWKVTLNGITKLD